MRKLACLMSLVALVFLFTSCEKTVVMKPVCKVAVKTLHGVADGVADVLQCTNPSAIAADLAEPLYKMELCERTVASGMLGDIVCPQVSEFVVGLGVGSLPAAWGCSGGEVSVDVEKALLDGCKKVLK